MLDHRLRRLPNIKPALDQCVVFAGCMFSKLPQAVFFLSSYDKFFDFFCVSKSLSVF